MLRPVNNAVDEHGKTRRCAAGPHLEDRGVNSKNSPCRAIPAVVYLTGRCMVVARCRPRDRQGGNLPRLPSPLLRVRERRRIPKRRLSSPSSRSWWRWRWDDRFVRACVVYNFVRTYTLRVLMFVRWQKRKRKSRAFGGGRDRADTHWAAILAESTRVDGKPTQQHVAYLGGITDSAIEIAAQRASSGGKSCGNLTSWPTGFRRTIGRRSKKQSQRKCRASPGKSTRNALPAGPSLGSRNLEICRRVFKFAGRLSAGNGKPAGWC